MTIAADTLQRNPGDTARLIQIECNGEHTRSFEGDPTAWKAYEIRVVVPVGSAPGTWGPASMITADKVGNAEFHDFVEILHFDVEPPARLL
jgi:hypothetical protein